MILRDIRQEARDLLQGSWHSLVPIWVVYFSIGVIPSMVFTYIIPIPLLSCIYSLFIMPPFIIAIVRIFLRIWKTEQVQFSQLFEGFDDYSRVFVAYLLVSLYSFLWSLLLIIPGIIAGLSYSMTFYIMAEDPSISASDAIRRSKEMMVGHKWELFCLGLSFIGWILLALLTFGIGLFWLESYLMTSYVIFYKKINDQDENLVNEAPEVPLSDEINELEQ